MSISGSLSDDFISYLRGTAKVIENPRARETPKAKHVEKNFDVVSADHSRRNPLEGEAFESRCHIHVASERYIAANRKAEHYAEPTDRYSDLEGALRLLIADWSISGLSGCKDAEQLGLSI